MNVFISYSSETLKQAEKLREALQVTKMRDARWPFPAKQGG
jgi:hypothetical protein